MKKQIIFAVNLLLVLCGCSSTTITETTYNQDGTVASVKTTKTSESPVVVAVGNTKDKHVVWHQGGFYANVGLQPSSNTYGLGLGTIDNTYASIVASDGTKDGAKVAKQFSSIVNASKYKLSVSPDGIESESTNEVSKNTNSNSEAKTQTEKAQ